MPYPELEKYAGEVSQCAMCAGCHANCPTYDAMLDESMSARGKLSLIDALLKGEIQLTEKFSEKMSLCLSCLNCSKVCPSGVDPVKIINAARSEIATHGKTDPGIRFILRHILPSNRRVRFLARLADSFLGNLFRRVSPKELPEIQYPGLKDRYPEVVEVSNPKMRILFFSGCMGDWVNQKACSQVIDFLSRNQIEVISPKDQPCCGAPAYYSGERDVAMELARRNLEIFRKWNPDYIIHNCATCGLMLKEVYALLSETEATQEIMEKLMDVHLFISQKVGMQRSFSKEKKIKATYHDPCHLARGQGVKEEPRELLRSIPWVEYVEMQDADACCGGAGMFSFKYDDLAREIALKKVEAIQKTGAEVVATGCPSCQIHISDALSRAGLNIPVVHTTQLLLKEDE